MLELLLIWTAPPRLISGELDVSHLALRAHQNSARLCAVNAVRITQVANLEKGQVNNLRYGGQRCVTQDTNLGKGQLNNLRYGLWDH